MSLARRIWQRYVPHSVRRALSDLRHLDSMRDDVKTQVHAMQLQIDELRNEIDELRSDQRTVAELMDVVESVALRSRTDLIEGTPAEKAQNAQE